MKKLLVIPLILIALLISLVASAYAISQTRYASAAGNYLFELFLDSQIQVEKITYNAPLHFSFEGVTYQRTQKQSQKLKTTYIPKVELWINRTPYQQGKWVLDSLLIDGLSLQQSQLSFEWQNNLTLHQLALNNFDLSYQDSIARGINIQIKKPLWHDDKQRIPFGEIQLSAEQFYYHGEALNQLLIDADYKPNNSTIFGLSFEWRDAEISGQAEQYDHGWSLVNMTLNKLNLTELEKLTALSSGQTTIFNNISHINSLDVLNSHFSSGDVQIVNLDASVENITLPSLSTQSLFQSLSWWQQESAYLSFNAESIAYQDQLLISPMAKLELSPNQVSIAEFDSDYLQGRIQLSGKLTPTTTKLDWLKATGLKLVEDTQQSLSLLTDYLDQQDAVAIDQLDILRSQVIQIKHAPFWQVSGLNVSGSNLELKRNQTLGLWNGEIELSANSLSYDDAIATQAVINSNSNDGAWELERLFIPLEKGYFDASGYWELNSLSRPWQLIAHGDGLPLKMIHTVANLPIQLDGELEFELNAHGLSGNKEMLDHSLTGTILASVRDAELTYTKAQGYGSAQPQSLLIPFYMRDLEVNSNRGRVSMSDSKVEGENLVGSLHGNIDLVMPKVGNIELLIEQECQQLSFDLLNNKTTSHHNCS
ncbi:AsmA family protein [Vibrio lamellibrachiae]|uniref:AsmA family protein n=1 Tax=Vibrio lamellibrachiae TaxID=2910253 RepID=UPI003D0EDD93